MSNLLDKCEKHNIPLRKLNYGSNSMVCNLCMDENMKLLGKVYTKKRNKLMKGNSYVSRN